MGAPKGNTNGCATRIAPLVAGDPSIQLAVRVPRSVAAAIDEALESGQLRSDWLREAIVEKLKASNHEG